MQVATTFAGQAAVALENARLYEDSVNRAAELDQRSQRLALLNRFSSQMSGLLNADEIQKVTAEELRKAFDALRVSVVRLDGQTATWTFAAPKQQDKFPKQLPNAPIFGQLRKSQGVFATEDFLSEPAVGPLTLYVRRGNDQCTSFTTRKRRQPAQSLVRAVACKEHLSTSEVELAITIANQASIALDSARLFQEVQRRAQETMALAEVGRDISSTLDLEYVLERINAYAKDLLQAETSAVYLPELESNVLHGIAVVGQDADEIKNSPMMIGEGILGTIAEKKVVRLLIMPRMIHALELWREQQRV